MGGHIVLNDLRNIELGSNGQQLTVVGIAQPGDTYILLGATNLIPPVVRIPIKTNTADSYGNISFTNPPTASAQEFYRISGN